MAKNKLKSNPRIGAVKRRLQTFNPKTGLWVKRDSQTGLFIDLKDGGSTFKGVQKESLDKLAITLNKLVKYDKAE